MWLTVKDDEFDHAFRAVLSNEGVWFFFGSDLARLLDFADFELFNLMFSRFRVRDLIEIELVRDLRGVPPIPHLDEPVVDLHSLEVQLDPSRPVLGRLRSLFYGADRTTTGVVVAATTEDERPGLWTAVEVYTGDNPLLARSLRPFLRKFRTRALRNMHGIARGELTPIPPTVPRSRIIPDFGVGKENLRC